MKWWVIGSVIAVVALAGGLTYYLARVQRASQNSQRAVPQTTIARRGDIVLSATGPGTLHPSNQVDLGFGGSTSAKLVTLNVNVSDQVKAGQLLA